MRSPVTSTRWPWCSAASTADASSGRSVTGTAAGTGAAEATEPAGPADTTACTDEAHSAAASTPATRSAHTRRPRPATDASTGHGGPAAANREK